MTYLDSPEDYCGPILLGVSFFIIFIVLVIGILKTFNGG